IPHRCVVVGDSEKGKVDLKPLIIAYDFEFFGEQVVEIFLLDVNDAHNIRFHVLLFDARGHLCLAFIVQPKRPRAARQYTNNGQPNEKVSSPALRPWAHQNTPVSPNQYRTRIYVEASNRHLSSSYERKRGAKPRRMCRIGM